MYICVCNGFCCRYSMFGRGRLLRLFPSLFMPDGVGFSFSFIIFFFSLIPFFLLFGGILWLFLHVFYWLRDPLYIHNLLPKKVHRFWKTPCMNYRVKSTCNAYLLNQLHAPYLLFNWRGQSLKIAPTQSDKLIFPQILTFSNWTILFICTMPTAVTLVIIITSKTLVTSWHTERTETTCPKRRRIK